MLGNMMMVTRFDYRLPLRWLMLLACLFIGIPPVAADSDAIEYLNSLRKEAGMTMLIVVDAGVQVGLQGQVYDIFSCILLKLVFATLSPS